MNDNDALAKAALIIETARFLDLDVQCTVHPHSRIAIWIPGSWSTLVNSSGDANLDYRMPEAIRSIIES